MKCADCKWCAVSSSNWSECRLHPPTYVKHTGDWRFPLVQLEEWCSHFESKIIPLNVVETKVSDK